MAFEALSSIPCEFESGNSVTITMPLAGFLASEGAATLYLSQNGSAVTNFVSTESGDNFTFTLSKTATAALAPGIYDYAIYFTYTAGERVSAGTGQVLVTANLAASQTPSQAQAMVTLLETAMQTFAATDKISVSFNGQSFTRANIKDYQQQWTFWKARVIAEQRAAARARGQVTTSTYAPTFGN